MFISVHTCLWRCVFPQKPKICYELVGESSKPLGPESTKEKIGSESPNGELSVPLWLWHTKKGLFGWDRLEALENGGENSVSEPPLLNTSVPHCSRLLQLFPTCCKHVWFFPALRQGSSKVLLYVIGNLAGSRKKNSYPHPHRWIKVWILFTLFADKAGLFLLTREHQWGIQKFSQWSG